MKRCVDLIEEKEYGKQVSTWRHAAVTESFKQGILIYMNPFQAMQVFAYEPSISSILATDETVDGKAFWYKKFAFTFGDNFTPKMERLVKIKEKVSGRMFEEVETIFYDCFDNDFGVKRAPRHFFMWVWMFYRVVAKERVRLSIERDKMGVCTANISQTTDIHTPGEYNVSSERYTFSLMLNEAFDDYYNLPMTSKYRIYLIAKPIIDVMYYMKMCLRIVKDILTVEAIIEACAAYEGQSLLALLVRRHKNRHDVGQFVLNHGNESIHTYIARTVDTICTTYPINLDVGEGVYLG